MIYSYQISDKAILKTYKNRYSLILMDKKLLDKNKFSVYSLFQLLNEEKVEYIYRGNFDTNITDSILSLAEINLNTQEDSIKIRKRVYFILVEGLQNITRHQETNPEAEDFNEGLVVLQRKAEAFIITTGNLIKNETIPELKENLEKINSLTAKELKEYYRKILNNKELSEKGGAGLGLIEIARKSGNKISYDFEEVSDTHSYFYMQTVISYTKEPYEVSSLKNMKLIHRFFIKNDIILNVTGIFNHDKLVYIISLLESQLSKQIVLKNKMFSIMIELMQNIVKHADDVKLNGTKGKHSLFLISSNEEKITLTSGNFIKNNKQKALEEHLVKINKMSHNELNKFHFNTLFNYKNKKEVTHGLGLLDIRIKSRNKIIYDFEKVDKNYSFISLKVALKEEVKRERQYVVEKTEETPEIILDEKQGKFLICGDSFPEDPVEFYKPVIDWLQKYSQNPRLFTLFEFKFRYLSTSSEKELIKIVSIIEEIAQSSAVVVRWYFQKNNEDSFNFGLEFSQLFNVDFNLVEYEKLNCEEK